MRLYLVQHGQAMTRDQDPARPLSEQGRADVRAVATVLGDAGVTVERVWHSGKLRAAQTAELLARTLARGRPVEAIKGLAPNDPVTEFVSDADVWDEDTLVCGHMPFVARLVSLLVLGDSGHAAVQYTPGSVVCLERTGTDRWVINWMLRPELLLAAIHGEEA